jgi:hypothetical protein
MVAYAIASLTKSSRFLYKQRRQSSNLKYSSLIILLPYFLFIAIANCIRTNQNPNSVRRCFAPPHTIWVLCPNKNGDSYTYDLMGLKSFLSDRDRIQNQDKTEKLMGETTNYG